MARKLEAENVDPRTQAGPEGVALSKAIDLYDTSLERRGAVKQKDLVSLLRRELQEPLGANRGVRTIDRPMLVKRITEIHDSGRTGTARDFRSRAGVFFGWLENEGLIERNPLAGYRQERRTRAQLLNRPRPGRAGPEAAAHWRISAARESIPC